MSGVETDISGTPLPPAATANTATGVDRVLAVPPIRDVPNDQATEFLLQGYAVLAAGGAAFVALTDPLTGLPFAGRVEEVYKGRIDSLLIYSPDMVAGVAPYLFFSLTLAGQLAPAWGFVAVYPRVGVASLSFDTVINLSPNQQIGMLAKNTDAFNDHFVGVYMHGWLWPKDTVEG